MVSRAPLLVLLFLLPACNWSLRSEPGCLFQAESAWWPIWLFVFMGVALALMARAIRNDPQLAKRPVRRTARAVLWASASGIMFSYGLLFFETQALTVDGVARELRVEHRWLLRGSSLETVPFVDLAGVEAVQSGKAVNLRVLRHSGPTLLLERQPWLSEQRLQLLRDVVAAEPGACGR